MRRLMRFPRSVKRDPDIETAYIDMKNASRVNGAEGPASRPRGYNADDRISPGGIQMSSPQDPTDAIRRQAVSFPDVATGTSCSQSSFKVGKGTFLFIGPGPKGKGFKAMFKLKASMPEAAALAEQDPERYEVGSTGWVTARFSVEEPMPKPIWEKWLAESYDLTSGTAKK